MPCRLGVDVRRLTLSLKLTLNRSGCSALTPQCLAHRVRRSATTLNCEVAVDSPRDLLRISEHLGDFGSFTLEVAGPGSYRVMAAKSTKYQQTCAAATSAPFVVH